jgi:hypothetical protein
VEVLRAARAGALARVQELADRLADEQARSEGLARSHKAMVERNDARLRAFISAPPVTATHGLMEELGAELERERELGLELAGLEGEIQASALTLKEAQSHLERLERSLALAMAQARTLAREQAQARSPRLRAIAVVRFLWRLLQARPGVWDGLIRNLYLGMRVVGLAAWMLPPAHRDRWKNESYNELEELKQEGVPLLGDSLRIASRTPWLTLVLWTGAWRRSPAARWLPRLKPLWIGLGTAAATFLGGAAGIGQSPTEFQMTGVAR